VLLILLAACAHSGWNFLAKQKAHEKNLIWFSSLAESILFLPVVILTGFQLGSVTLSVVCLLATGLLHLLYTECLLRGYRASDLSIVYPLARGTGPLLSSIGAIFVLRESPSITSVSGTLLVAVGVVTVCGGFRALYGRDARKGVFWGTLTGVMIASYTLVDGYAVKALLLSPFLVEYAGNGFRTLVLTTKAQSRNSNLGTELRRCWKEALGIAILMPLGYILVLFAMRIAPVSHVAPAREISMMLGAWMGGRFLNEGDVGRRVVGSGLIATGVAALALG
jgi:uncharacterized membrane protein